jgi:hypothetical protein
LHHRRDSEHWGSGRRRHYWDWHAFWNSVNKKLQLNCTLAVLITAHKRKICNTEVQILIGVHWKYSIFISLLFLNCL